MVRKAILAAAALVAMTTAASAKFYRVQLDGYCDVFFFNVDKGLVVGQAFGTATGCANNNIVGTVVALPVGVPPKGPAISFGWDFGSFAIGPKGFNYEGVFYFNLSNHYYAAYATSDGKHQGALVGTWSFIKDNTDIARASALPSVSQKMRSLLGPTTH